VYWFGKGRRRRGELPVRGHARRGVVGATHDRPQGFVVRSARSRWSAASSTRTTSGRTGTSIPMAATSRPWSSRPGRRGPAGVLRDLSR
jgi:hypothetical protein